MKSIAQQITKAVDVFLQTTSSQINWSQNPEPGKWTNKEIIGHLIDSAQINLQRLVRCTYEDGFKLIYFQDEWVKAQHYNNADAEDLLDLWKLINRQLVRVLENYPSDRLSATCDNGRDHVSFHTVTFLADDYLAHMQHHIYQLTGGCN